MKLIGIYPCTSQPPTKAHLQVYKKLKSMSGPDTFIVITDRTPTPDAPLNFGDKEQIWVRHGIPDSHIIKAEDWKHPIEIFNNFSPKRTKVVFFLNHKETKELSHRKTMLGQFKSNFGVNEIVSDNNSQDGEDLQKIQQNDENKEVWLDSENRMSYFQPYKGNENTMESLSKHGYVKIVDDTQIDGKPVSTGNIRQVLGSPRYNDNEKKKFFHFIFGWFDVGLYTLMVSKFKMAHQVSASDEDPATMPSMSSMIKGTPTPQNMGVPKMNPPVKGNIKKKIQELVHEVLDEIMDEDFDSEGEQDPSTDMASTDMASTLGKEKNPAQQRVDAMKKKTDLVKKKSQSERDYDGLEKDLKWKQSDILRKRKDELPNKRKEIDMLNKQIANPSSI